MYRVKVYESKLATLTVIHGVVQKENDKLRAELEQAERPAFAIEDELKEEFSRRLGAADQAIARLQASILQHACPWPGVVRRAEKADTLLPPNACINSCAVITG